jgi:hypothetical protein
MKKVILLLIFLLIPILCFIQNTPVKAATKQGRHIYVIGGANKGDRIVVFKKEDLYTKYPWEIFAIEANP